MERDKITLHSFVMEPFALIIFGITSNLSQIKLIPALYDMTEESLLPKKTVIVGNARRDWSQENFKKFISQVLHSENRHHQHPINEQVVNKLCKQMHYLKGDLNDQGFFASLKKTLSDFQKKGNPCQNKMFYLATYPDLYKSIFENLKQYGLDQQKNGWVRILIEKPIGHDLSSAKQLNQMLNDYFQEDQIFRLDHYLGKETLQNILTFRFGNGIFEPLINKEFVDHIQIQALENFGIGQRGGYYDTVGSLKDVGQNHQLQMLAFATMDAPSEFTSQSIARERIKILKNLIPLPDKLVLGQYEGYLKEENVSTSSSTDTFYAMKTEINNDRFKGVPIYIRSGKMLKEYVTEISICFKTPLNRLFKHLDCGEEPNILIYRIQPNEGVVLKIVTKKPGYDNRLEPEYMQFCYRPKDANKSFHYMPDPYNRLLVDALRGDKTFFNHADEVEAQWAFIDPLTKKGDKPVIYQPGTWGPKEADKLIEEDGRSWFEPSMEFCRI